MEERQMTAYGLPQSMRAVTTRRGEEIPLLVFGVHIDERVMYFAAVNLTTGQASHFMWQDVRFETSGIKAARDD